MNSLTFLEAEARFYLCAYQYRIAAHGERSVWRALMEKSNAQCTAAENAATAAQRFEQMEAMVP